jgi:predicted transport protein
MPTPNYVKYEQILMKTSSEFNERWLQDKIADDPALLGLGDLVLKDKERSQPNAGRLDLLLQDPESETRYEVEIQLGSTDERHIIRTIEYWDIERKRYPQYEHVAVIVAEDITSRFLNIISLFNGHIPIIALQLQAVRVASTVTLVPAKIVDLITLGLEEEEEEQVTDRTYWEGRGSSLSIAMLDQLLEMIKTLDNDFELKYNKFYVGLTRSGHPFNFAIFRPKKQFLRIHLRLPNSTELKEKIENSGIDLLGYDNRFGTFKFRLTPETLKQNKELINQLLKESFSFLGG